MHEWPEVIPIGIVDVYESDFFLCIFCDRWGTLTVIKHDSWSRIVPFAIYICFIAVADLLGRFGYGPGQLLWLYPVKIAAVAAALWFYRRSYSELLRLDLDGVTASIAAAVGVAVFVLWISLNANWMVVGRAPGFDPNSNGALDWRWVAIRISGAALIVPVMEELFWRSFLMRWMMHAEFMRQDPARIKIGPFIVTVILFGFEHNLWLAGIVAGAAYSVLYVRSRRLWVPILAHSVTNGLLGIWIVCTAQWSYW